MTNQERRRYTDLIGHGFIALEAREFMILPKNDPVLRLLIRDRERMRANFETHATKMVMGSRWSSSMVSDKWIAALGRLYTERHWRVVEGARGNQDPMPKNAPNPWAMFRSYLKETPGKRDVSPWQVRQIKKGKTKLEKGLLFVQSLERKGNVSLGQLQRWIAEKQTAIAGARGQRRTQLTIELHRLQRLEART